MNADEVRRAVGLALDALRGRLATRDDLCTAALRRLFPEAPEEAGPWAALLWSTGRRDLPGRPAPADWRWDGSPR